MKNNLVACTMDLTEGCNLACDYCFTWSNHKPRKLPEELGKRIIDWWLPQTDPNKYIQLSFWGGEPLLEFKLMKRLIAHANELNKSLHREMEFGGTTNGVLYTPDVVEWCAKNRSLFLISLDGVKAAHDKHRKFPNGKGSFDIVEKNVKAALKMVPQHQVRFSLNTDTIQYFFETIQYFVEELGITSLAFSPVFEGPWTEGDNLERMREQFDLAIEYIIMQQKQGTYIKMKHIHDEAITNGQQQGEMRNPCGAGNFYMGWGVDGFGWPCHRFNKHGISSEERAKSPIIIAKPTGNSFEWCNEDWNNQFINFCKEIPDGCKDCDLYGRSVCAGGCYAVNFDMTGDIRKSFPNECAYNKVQHEAGLYFAKRLEEEGITRQQIEPKTMDQNSQADKCVCYNMCYAENTSREIIHSDKRVDFSCHCYQTAYMGNEAARPLSEKRTEEDLKKQFMGLSKRILETHNIEKTPEQMKLEQEILDKTIQML